MNIKLRTRLTLAQIQYSKGSMKFAQVATDKGELYWDEDGEVKVGSEVYQMDAEGNPVLPADGDYETETRILTVEAGVVTEIQEKESRSNEVENEMEEQPVAEYVSVAEFNALKEQFIALAELVKDLAGEVDVVDEGFKKLDEKFEAVTKTSVKMPAQEMIEAGNSVKTSQLSKFGL